ncbi:hypothetical protein [Arthrobacter koreensis]|uniref:hypothetical protein n=1 Tax=Arthrobacter koreensis TaxID=199136 RepID=UPI0038014F7F
MTLLTEIPRTEAAPTPDIDQQFEEITKNFTVIDLSTARMPDKNRITVMLDLPHLKKYGRNPTKELVYGCNFKVAVGDLVSCPPTPRNGKWTTGIVVALNGNGYRGPAKNVRKIKKPSTPESETSTS